MVFSFFKKRPQKMPERPAARPRAPESRPEVRAPKPLIVEVEPLSEPLPDLEFTSSGSPRPIPVEKKIEAPASAVPEEIALAVGEFDFEGDFTESSVMAIDVEHAGEPLQADIEQVVVMFANGQDSAARALLEMLIRAHPGREGQRFWALLFDLLQVVGDRPAFEKLTVEFTKACEISPPSWRQAQPISAGNGSGTQDFVLQGVLTADGAQPVAELAKLVGQGPVEKRAIRVDCGKLIGCDDWVAGQLAELLSQARRCGPALMLENTAGLLGRLNERLVVGEASHAPAWLLLLELLQRHSTQEIFEERAVDYAVTFELSPPSWESPPEKAVKTPALVSGTQDDAYYFSGEIKNSRFDELLGVFEMFDQPVLDFSAVRRMDFYSAGQLVNRLSPYKIAGREIIIRSPNHLVAELMAVVGLSKQARIIVPKS
ncbi:MAG: hypothetical protein CVU16_05920 [Betaproteobacteria bacterium HGW-Betaproteobacteria-10]|nr:MAG: hypothetical protein CVU16_05920 [Betaproteobacteria bacterium HGW-Betaproteobacteria-10]